MLLFPCDKPDELKSTIRTLLPLVSPGFNRIKNLSYTMRHIKCKKCIFTIQVEITFILFPRIELHRYDLKAGFNSFQLMCRTWIKDAGNLITDPTKAKFHPYVECMLLRLLQKFPVKDLKLKIYVLLWHTCSYLRTKV